MKIVHEECRKGMKEEQKPQQTICSTNTVLLVHEFVIFEF